MEPLNQERDVLIEEAMQLWRIHAETYRTNPYRYFFLIAWKREIMQKNKYKKMTLRKIPLYILDEYPDLPFFRIIDEPTALGTLEEMGTPELSYLVYHLKYQLECNHAYRTINNRVMELVYELAHINVKPSAFGVDTEARYSCSYKPSKRPNHINNNN